jgi:TPR repeat protein
MIRYATLLLLAAAAPALAQVPPNSGGSTIEQRIEQGMPAADEAESFAGDGLLGGELPPNFRIGISDAMQSDVSLDPNAKPSRLRTSLEPLDIEHRIDKGLTAAGESSAFPPDYAFGAFQRGWFLTAFSLALERATAGDAIAQTLLGVLFERGLGVRQELAEAAQWYRLAAQSGDAEAQYALARMHLVGAGLAADIEEAADLFQQAADQGHAVAAREFGYLLLQGKGREKNPMLAAAYLRRAAAGGDMDAQYTLAGLFVEGVGVVPDPKQAARWFAEAAANGHLDAQVEYGIILFNGRGVPKNERAAADWFMAAANADSPSAQLRLARLYVEGKGVEQDDADAARWYLIAKNRGLEDEFLEDWLGRLDADARETAAVDAEAWARTRDNRLQTASAAPPVDNAAQ